MIFNYDVSDLQIPNDIGIIGNQTVSTLKSSVSRSGITHIYFNDLGYSMWATVIACVEGSNKTITVQAGTVSIVLNTSDGGATWRDRIFREDSICASLEYGMTSTRQYAPSDYILINGTLYRATALIPINTALTVGTNIEATSITDSLPKYKQLWSGSATSGTITLSKSFKNFTFLVFTYRANSINRTIVVHADHLNGGGSYSDVVDGLGVDANATPATDFKYKMGIALKFSSETTATLSTWSNNVNIGCNLIGVYGIKFY